MQHLSFRWLHFTLANDALPSKRPFWQPSPVTLALTFYYWERCPRCSWWTCPCWRPSPWQRARNSACGPATPSVCMITKTQITTLKYLMTQSIVALSVLHWLCCFWRFYEGKQPSLWEIHMNCIFYLFHADLLTFAAEIHEHGVHWQAL